MMNLESTNIWQDMTIYLMCISIHSEFNKYKTTLFKLGNILGKMRNAQNLKERQHLGDIHVSEGITLR
jgi:hypothetical protein